MCQYGIPGTGVWFHTTMQICFWAYASVAVLASASIYLIIWSTQYAVAPIFNNGDDMFLTIRTGHSPFTR